MEFSVVSHFNEKLRVQFDLPGVREEGRQTDLTILSLSRKEMAGSVKIGELCVWQSSSRLCVGAVLTLYLTQEPKIAIIKSDTTMACLIAQFKDRDPVIAAAVSKKERSAEQCGSRLAGNRAVRIRDVVTWGPIEAGDWVAYPLTQSRTSGRPRQVCMGIIALVIVLTSSLTIFYSQMLIQYRRPLVDMQSSPIMVQEALFLAVAACAIGSESFRNLKKLVSKTLVVRRQSLLDAILAAGWLPATSQSRQSGLRWAKMLVLAGAASCWLPFTLISHSRWDDTPKDTHACNPLATASLVIVGAISATSHNDLAFKVMEGLLLNGCYNPDSGTAFTLLSISLLALFISIFSYTAGAVWAAEADGPAIDSLHDPVIETERLIARYTAQSPADILIINIFSWDPAVGTGGEISFYETAAGGHRRTSAHAVRSYDLKTDLTLHAGETATKCRPSPRTLLHMGDSRLVTGDQNRIENCPFP